MKMNWDKFKGLMLNVTLHENYGLQEDRKSDQTLYEIVFKTGKLLDVFEDGLLLEAQRENMIVKIFIPHQSIKCVEIFDIKGE